MVSITSLGSGRLAPDLASALLLAMAPLDGEAPPVGVAAEGSLAPLPDGDTEVEAPPPRVPFSKAVLSAGVVPAGRWTT